MSVTMEAGVRQVVTGKAESHSRTRLQTRDLIDISDEPEERGGTNKGFSPTELFNAALLASTNVVSQKIAKKIGVRLSSLDMTLDVGFNRRGVLLEEEVDLPFEDMMLTINVTTDASEEEIQLLREELAKYCPVSKMVLGAGTKLERVWNVTRQQNR